MAVPPIVDRELRRQARSQGTYRARALAAGVAALIAAGMLILSGGFSAPSQMGRALFATLSWLALVFCLIEGARTTSDCVSGEKREGTLGLLFLTDLRGFDVALGKFAGTALGSFYNLVAVLPVLAMPLLMGGVTAGEYWRTVWVLLNVLFLSTTAGLWVSSVSRDERKAMGGALAVMAGVCLVPVVFSESAAVVGWDKTGRFGSLSPLAAFLGLGDIAYGKDPVRYWLSVVATQVMGWLLLVAACLIVPRSWREETPLLEARGEGRLPWSRVRYRRRELRERFLAVNPVYWLALRRTGPSVVLWLVLGLAALGVAGMWVAGGMGELDEEGFIAVYFAGGMILNWVVRLWVAAQACHFLNEARTSGGLELMLATPLTGGEMLRGHAMHLRRLFLPAVTAVFLIHLGVLTGGMLFSEGDLWESPTWIFPILIGGFTFVGFLMDILALAWVGTWLGLTERTYTRAVTKTVVFVLIYPLALYLCPFAVIFWWFGIPFLRIGVAIAFVAWANQSLRDHFRLVAAQRSEQHDSEVGWWPFRRPRSAAGLPTRPPRIPAGV